MLADMASVLEVRRDDLETARVADVEPARLEAGQARFVVERFGLTTNNVTYGIFGDRLRYWTFFPSDAEGWGRVPAWGFATAVETRCADVREGTRVFGYVPMGGELVLTPRHVDERSLHDGSGHRAKLPAAYNRYRLSEPSDRDDATLVLQPLFVTSVVLARSLEGAPRVVLSSASSKTALGTAYLLARRGTKTAGITASLQFVTGLGVYDEVVDYDSVERLQRGPSTFVVLAGDTQVRSEVHRHLGDDLLASVLVGATHVETAPATEAPLPGPQPTFFFAPDHVSRGIDNDALGELLRWSAGWLEIDRRDGSEAVLAAWGEAARGELPPTKGLSLAL
jgi:hypothetical protein